MRIFVGAFLLWAFLESAWGSMPCERVAVINHQEVLLETTSRSKGEGLRPYLEKDEEALRHFERYQERNRIYPFNTLLGIAGPGLLLTGLVLDSGSKQKKSFLGWGAVLVVTNFLVTKTIQGASESHLEKAIEEYNKRNFPKIDFNTYSPKAPRSGSLAFGIKKDWSF